MWTRWKTLISLWAALFLLVPLTDTRAAEVRHKLVLQISDNDPDKMNAVLNVAANVSKLYAEKAEDVDIQIVAFNAGLHMLRDDTSPVKERLQTFAGSMPNVSFKACNNTREGMAKREGKAIPIVSMRQWFRLAL